MKLRPGGASGIGKATVELFHRHGAYIVFSDVNDEDGIQFEKDLGTYILTYLAYIVALHISVQMYSHGHPCRLSS
jgi:NAD(P)-dependent dehydrogenase (short-subunit alcohol dehydrogenase family)